MATTINWATKVITVNRADLTLVSGTLYEHDTDAFRKELNALQASEEGIWADTTHLHNTAVTVAGTTFARTIEIINGYSVQYLPDELWSVRLAGSNNNIFDVQNGILVQNSVQVIPGNSAGLITYAVGSGLDAGQDAMLTAINAQLTNIEGANGHKALMRAIFSSVCAQMAMTDNGDGTYTMHFRNMGDTKDRMVVDGPLTGGRTSITWDMS